MMTTLTDTKPNQRRKSEKSSKNIERKPGILPSTNAKKNLKQNTKENVPNSWLYTWWAEEHEVIFLELSDVHSIHFWSDEE